MKFETEIIAMTSNLVNGHHKDVCGCTTSVSKAYLYTCIAQLIMLIYAFVYACIYV